MRHTYLIWVHTMEDYIVKNHIRLFVLLPFLCLSLHAMKEEKSSWSRTTSQQRRQTLEASLGRLLVTAHKQEGPLFDDDELKDYQISLSRLIESIWLMNLPTTPPADLLSPQSLEDERTIARKGHNKAFYHLLRTARKHPNRRHRARKIKYQTSLSRLVENAWLMASAQEQEAPFKLTSFKNEKTPAWRPNPTRDGVQKRRTK